MSNLIEGIIMWSCSIVEKYILKTKLIYSFSVKSANFFQFISSFRSLARLLK